MRLVFGYLEAREMWVVRSAAKLGRAMRIPSVVALGLAAWFTGAVQVRAEPQPNIAQATLQEPGQQAPEISTETFRQVLATGSAVVLDARPHEEWAVGHIPGARNVAPRPGIPLSQYVSDVAEIGRLLNEDKTASLVLYCNGPFCGKSKRLSSELIKAGYTHVQRYQLGIPVWRALGGVTQIEQDGLLYVVGNDRTAVLMDARATEQPPSPAIPHARGIPLTTSRQDIEHELELAKNDGRLPMLDHNTRIVVFGADGQQARLAAEAIAHEAFHNVGFYAGPVDDDLVQKLTFAQRQLARP